MIEPSKLNFSKLDGLIPAVIVDINSDKILMLGFMNEESLKITLETKKVTFFSRSKNKLWTKGETSGNYLYLKNIVGDCDNDSILAYVVPQGPTCHTGNYSCFNLKESNAFFLEELEKIIRQRKSEMPAGSYTTKLFREGSDRIIQKLGEESIEVLIAAKNRNKKEIIYESADLIYHFLVLLVYNEINLSDIVDELIMRHKSKM